LRQVAQKRLNFSTKLNVTSRIFSIAQSVTGVLTAKETNVKTY